MTAKRADYLLKRPVKPCKAIIAKSRTKRGYRRKISVPEALYKPF
jgi:hypothetical protein